MEREFLIVDGFARGRPRPRRIRRRGITLSLSIVIGLAAVSTGSGAPAAAIHRDVFPAFANAVPVLLYHRVAATDSSHAVSPAAFAAQMQRLHDLGFETITLDRYVRFMRGERVDLPPRALLITFDDAYLSALDNADAVLARYGWTAVMYVPTGFVGRPGHLTWDQLRHMQATGRWEIDEHAGNGHVSVSVDAQGTRGPFYANELWTAGSRETFAHYKNRVSNDIADGAAKLARFLRGWRPHGTFAVPFNNYGDHGSNDPRIEPWLARYLAAHFVVSFVQLNYDFTTPHQAFANRIAVSKNIGPRTLEERLLAGLRATIHLRRR